MNRLHDLEAVEEVRRGIPCNGCCLLAVTVPTAIIIILLVVVFVVL